MSGEERPVKVRHLMAQLQDLARRGFGDAAVQIEKDGSGLVTGIEASASGGVRLTTSGGNR